MTIKKKGLGRGLSALLSDTPETSKFEEAPAKSGGGMSEIPVSEIEVNPYQPRKDFAPEALQELVDSIKVHGIIQPVTVRRLARNQYQLISGERRYQAARRAGLKTIPAYIRSADDQQMLEMALVENIQRENLNPIEIALSYQRLLTECNLKQEQLGDRVGKNRSTVTNYLRLLKLPPAIQIALRDNKLSMGHARAIINIENPDIQLVIFKRILSDDLSVRQVEELARNLTTTRPKGGAASKPGSSREITQLQGRLSSHFGTKVTVKSDGKKGEIKIPFLSIQDLNRILDLLKL
ncbi:MAG: ParB/RepB/Spo0J family partition protein [Cyclobacteriaceae bacterium]|nr:ParB/RepB/Spo0J family partition protein [Cyclobacteriaceae bacterium]